MQYEPGTHLGFGIWARGLEYKVWSCINYNSIFGREPGPNNRVCFVEM